MPVIGNVYLLTKGVAKMFHSGKLAGCVVTDQLLETVEKYAAGPDKGKKFFLELAAKQLAVFKGLGFAAGYIGGMAKADTFGQIIDLAESFAPGDWREFIKEIQFSQPDEFFLFEHDPATGLADPPTINREYLEFAAASVEVERSDAQLPAFAPGCTRWRSRATRRCICCCRRFSPASTKSPVSSAAWRIRWKRCSKAAMYGCEDCGDCSLPECAYLCPKRWCSKCGRNGPCGGSAGGRCELDDKNCLWARIYERLKYYGEAESMLDRPVTLYNATLKNTSSWANLYLDRDHHAGEK